MIEYGAAVYGEEPIVVPESIALGLLGKKGYRVFAREVRPRVEGEWQERTDAGGDS